jgi:SAM-dependent methyltransferase
MSQSRSRERTQGLLPRLRTALRERGIIHVLRSIVVETMSRLDGYLGYFYHRAFKSKASFSLDGRTHRYFYHIYGKTWKNERAVEVPIVWEIAKDYRGETILEIGNVLPNYFPLPHDVVDKYEVAEGVVNCDVVDFRPAKKYDLIVSISTMEHVGWEENPREPEKILRAFENLRSLLAPGGRILVTMPLGLNPALDGYIRDGALRFAKLLFMKRMQNGNRWEEAGWGDVRDVPYDHQRRRANALVIGVIENIMKPTLG